VRLNYLFNGVMKGCLDQCRTGDPLGSHLSSCFFAMLVVDLFAASSRSRYYNCHPRHVLWHYHFHSISILDYTLIIFPSPFSDTNLLIRPLATHHTVILVTHVTEHSMPTARQKASPFGC
jgi:hypothetical protein